MTGKDYFEEGQSAFVSGDHQKSLEMFSKALEADYEPVTTQLSRGAAYLHVDDNDRALDDFTGVLERDPDNERAHYYRGVVHLKKGDYRQAAEDLDRSISRNPERGAAFLARGMARAELNEEEGAVEDFKQAMGYASVEVDSFLHMLGSYRTGFERSMALLEGERGPVTQQLNEAEIDKLKRWMEP